MNYFLLSLLLLIRRNDAEDIITKDSTHWNDSFAVNIGAGYEVGASQSSNNSPKSTAQTNDTQNYLTTETTPSLRESRTLSNFTPHVERPNFENIKTQFEPKNHVHDSRSAASNYFGHNDIQRNQVQGIPSYYDHKYVNVKPSLVDLQNIVNGLEKDNQYSKIVQVIKVPAIYEIHLQSDNKKSHKNLLVNSLIQDPNLNWKYHYESKPFVNNFIENSHSNWQIENKPYNTEPLSDEYLKSLNNYYKQKEGLFSEDSEKYHNSNFVHSHDDEVTPMWIDHLQENEYLEPIISHHYKHAGNFDDKLDNKRDYVNYSFTEKKKPSGNTLQNYFPHTNIHYTNSNLKRDIEGKNFNPSTAFSSTSPYKQYQNKNLLSLYHRKLNLRSKPIKNQDITEHNYPEAIHEVPAPYLGKQMYPRSFEAQSFNKTKTYSQPLSIQGDLNHKAHNIYQKSKQSIHNNPENFASSALGNKPMDPIPQTVYGLVSKSNYYRQNHVKLSPKIVPTSEEFASYINKNQNLVYGKRTEPVLSPYQINSPRTTTATFGNNQRNRIYKYTPQHFDYPGINDNFSRASSYNPNVLQRVSKDESNFQNKDCSGNNKLYENIPLTTHIPHAGTYNNKIQETINQNSNTKTYEEENVSRKSEGNFNDESKLNPNSTKRVSEGEYNNFPIKESPENTLSDATKNMSNKLFTKNRYMNNNPLRRTSRGQNNGAHIDYVIYITEKTRYGE